VRAHTHTGVCVTPERGEDAISWHFHLSYTHKQRESAREIIPQRGEDAAEQHFYATILSHWSAGQPDGMPVVHAHTHVCVCVYVCVCVRV
jgi:hypothetical protein